MLVYPQIDPIAFSIGMIDIRWYGIAYATGILLGWAYLLKLIQSHYLIFEEKTINDFIPWVTIGIIIGGRLGHVLLYGGKYYLQNPLEVLMIWKPGMAFHGGIIGVFIATVFFCRKHKIHYQDLADAICIVAPIGIFFGRVANFINSELWGTVSLSWFAMVFPNAGILPRHPSQLYEAFLEGIVIFLLQLYFVVRKNKLKQRGFTTGLFLLAYSIARIFVEFFRYPEDGYWGYLTMGQVYSVPMFLYGIWLLYKSSKK